jgi:hypothetical protein
VVRAPASTLRQRAAAAAAAKYQQGVAAEWRLDLYHRCMDHFIADLNDLYSRTIYLRFADNLIRLSRAFNHVFLLDGTEGGSRDFVRHNSMPGLHMSAQGSGQD